MRDDHAAGVRLEEPHDVLQGNRFSNSASAQDADGFRRVHFEADVTEHMIIAKCLGDVLELDIARILIGGVIRGGRVSNYEVTHVRSVWRSSYMLAACKFFLRHLPIFRRIHVAEHLRREMMLRKFWILNHTHWKPREHGINFIAT